MNIHELSDLDADALTITTRGPYTWVTCTADGEEVTVGPVPTQKLTTALPSHSDDMDGGVTCALIEKETEDRGGPLDETVDFWRARWKEAADRADARDLAARQWKEATRRAFRDQAGLRHELDLADRRAEKAEKERDEALWLAKTAADQADDALGMVARGECHDCIRDAAVIRDPRPLTPDAITDEMVERACRALHGWPEYNGVPWEKLTGWERDLTRKTVRRALAAALTEPPARPEGAEEIHRLMLEFWGSPDDSATGVDLANHLAERGVRVVTEDGGA